jgi:hypothetical protein
MFALVAAAAQHTQELFLKNGMSEAAIRDHEIQKNSDMIDFCTTTYSSIRNREYCIDSAFPCPDRQPRAVLDALTASRAQCGECSGPSACFRFPLVFGVDFLLAAGSSCDALTDCAIGRIRQAAVQLPQHVNRYSAATASMDLARTGCMRAKFPAGAKVIRYPREHTAVALKSDNAPNDAGHRLFSSTALASHRMVGVSTSGMQICHSADTGPASAAARGFRMPTWPTLLRVPKRG